MIQWNNGVGTMVFHVHVPHTHMGNAPMDPSTVNGAVHHVIVCVRRQEDQAKIVARDMRGNQMEAFAFGGDVKDETLELLAMRMLEKHLPVSTTVFK